MILWIGVSSKLIIFSPVSSVNSLLRAWIKSSFDSLPPPGNSHLSVEFGLTSNIFSSLMKMPYADSLFFGTLSDGFSQVLPFLSLYMMLIKLIRYLIRLWFVL